MKTKSLCLTSVLLLGCLLSLAQAQPFTTLYSFTGGNDGGSPAAGLILSGSTLFGTTSASFEAGTNGSIFAMDEDGTGFTNLYSFTNGSDGSMPMAGLILSGSTLYGTASQGGRHGYGTVFALNTNGNVFKTLYAFTNGSDGSVPLAGLALSGATLYGVASDGGASGKGTVFSLTTNGMNFVPLHSFTGAGAGSHPLAGLVLSGATLYGEAPGSGGTANGVVFSLNTNGGGFASLHQFSVTNDNGNAVGTNSDGADPVGGLVLSGNLLYGTASVGGIGGYGTVFSLNIVNTNFTTLHAFTNGDDGATPLAGLVLSGGTLYGTASAGGNNNFDLAQEGTNGFGTVFSVSTTGANFTSLYAFTGGNDGFDPAAGLILAGTTLYGTAYAGGEFVYSGSVFASSSTAHRLTTLLSFNSDPNNLPNGQGPEAGLLISGSTLYGTAAAGGAESGSVFALNTNGTGEPDGIYGIDFSQFSFTTTSADSFGVGTNSEGIAPTDPLILSGNMLYGTASEGGAGGYGTVFSLTTNGLTNFIDTTGFAVLYSFTNGSDGANPLGGLVLSGNTLYGTTSQGGLTSNGTVFSVSTTGLGFKALYGFTNGSDGSMPMAGLLLSGSTLYGNTYYGGVYDGQPGYGTIFSLNTDGSGFKTLYTFTNGFDGANPEGGLIISGNTLYGTAPFDGIYQGFLAAGTVFSLNLNTDPPSFQTLYTFTAGSDGAQPEAALLLSGHTLYGTTAGFGITSGSIFALNTNGSGFTPLYDFAFGTDGIAPQSSLIIAGNTLYGTASSGGSFINYGTVFALNISSFLASSAPAPIDLNIAAAGKDVILSWTDPSGAFSLQSSPKLTAVFTNVPGAASPYTNAVSGSAQFFRLAAPN